MKLLYEDVIQKALSSAPIHDSLTEIIKKVTENHSKRKDKISLENTAASESPERKKR